MDQSFGSADPGGSSEGVEIRHEVLHENHALQNRVNSYATKIVLTSTDDAVNKGLVVEVLDSLYKKIDSLYDKFISTAAKPDDKAQMVVYTTDMDHPISTPLRLVTELTADHLLTCIKKAQNSGMTISMADQLVIEFFHIRLDKGWAVAEDPRPGGSLGHRYLLYFNRQESKKSLVEFANPGDKLCLAKAVVVGKAKVKYEQSRSQKVSKNRKDAEKSEEEVVLQKEYEALRGRKNNTTKTNKKLQKAIDKLYDDASVPRGKIGDLKILEKFEQASGMRVKVVSLEHNLDFIYKGTNGRPEDTIYLLYSKPKKAEIGHYSLITSLTGLFCKKFFCTVCDYAYNNVSGHRCPDIKDWCFACYDRNCQDRTNKTVCQGCKASLWSATCAKRHKWTSCEEKWKCPKCFLKYPRMKVQDQGQLRHKTDHEMEAMHNCNDYYCSECEGVVCDDHLCFIRRKELNHHQQKLMFFDFETEQSTGVHKVNYAHARYFKPKEVKKKNKKDKAREDLSDHTLWEGEWHDLAFSGETTLQDFLAVITDVSKFEGYTVVAHNLRGYDGIFILKELVENCVTPDVIVKGQKIMCLTIPGTKVKMLDSFNFLPMALARLPGSFGLKCGAKGYFPHFFNTPDNWNYVGELPHPSYYGIDSMMSGDRTKFLAWYNEQKAANTVFNFQEELASYCKQDVHILTECCLAYRKVMCEETGCDPFTYLTCASVCNAVYRAKFMPERSIARVPPAGYAMARYSDESLEWLEYLREFGSFPDLLHAANSSQGEKEVGGRYKVDGYDKESNTVFEYHGCFFHGCPSCFPDREIRNPNTRKRLAMALTQTKKREAEIKELGYNLITIWGCQWKAQKEDPDVKILVKFMDVPTPLQPRDAFFGGRTETFKLVFEDEEGGVGAGYDDVTSLYPWVNANMQYPVGHPEVVTHNFQLLDKYFGLVKCLILPPQDLYLPVLPMHTGQKLLFPLCRTCTEHFQVQPCSHTPMQRALEGTWFTEEVKLALEKGYEMIKIHTIWHFKETTTDLFSGYVRTFYKMKLLSSKAPYNNSADMEQYIKEVAEKEKIDIKDVQDFKENPGRRQLTKLMLNNLWGRYGMQENMSKSCFVSNFEDLVAMFRDETIEVQSVRPVSENVVQVVSKAKSTEFMSMRPDTNIFIAVVTTGWARIRLYQELDKLKERAMYCDTDSVVYKRSRNPEENLKIGNFLGDMTDELDKGDRIISFVSGGPKNYAYRTGNGKVVVKVKGFTLNHVNSQAFTFENVKRIILNGVETGAAGENDDDRVPVVPQKVRRMCLEQDRQDVLVMHLDNAEKASAFANGHCISVFNPTRIVRTRKWEVLKKSEQKIYSFCFDKRIVLSNYDSVPYGYVGPLG